MRETEIERERKRERERERERERDRQTERERSRFRYELFSPSRDGEGGGVNRKVRDEGDTKKKRRKNGKNRRSN